MRTPTHRSLEKLVEEQLVKWQRLRSEQQKATGPSASKPCISISREPGCGGYRGWPAPCERPRDGSDRLENHPAGCRAGGYKREGHRILDEKEVRMRTSGSNPCFGLAIFYE